VFLPKHPLTRPKLARIEESEAKLDVETLVANAVASDEVIDIYPK
jgi:thiamine biosynthesis protein ThiI